MAMATVREPRWLDKDEKIPNPHAGTVHRKPEEDETYIIRPRQIKGGKRPERRPRACICQQVNRLVAEKIRDGAATAINLCRQSHSDTLAGKCSQLVRDLCVLAYNVQFGNLEADEGADMAARKLKRFSRMCR